MEINVRDDSRTVDIWLTRAEGDDPAIRARLEPLYRDYQGRNYLVAVFCSGDCGLYQQTSGLLCYNRRRVAQLEAEREQQSERSLSM